MQTSRGFIDLLRSDVVRETGEDVDHDEALTVPKAQLRRRKRDGSFFVALKMHGGVGSLWLFPKPEIFRRMVSEYQSFLDDLDRRNAKVA